MNERETRALAGEVGAALRAAGWLCATAESCTGGLLAGAITSCPGSSLWFERGFVTYSNAAKIEQRRVSPDTLERFGAVSEQIAMEMAGGVLAVVPRAHLALSTTGIAGPGGATPGKPVGMVCFGIARSTATEDGSAASKVSIVTPTATLTTTVPGSSAGPISRSSSGTTCGLTATMTSRAPATAARFAAGSCCVA